MNIVAAQERLVGARNLAEVLDAAYDAFEDLIAVIDGSEEPGGGVFTAYVVAAGRAADGRDAIAAAPSLPPAGRPGAVERGTGRSGAEELAGLSRVIADRLSEYASLAEEAGDRAACLDGAESARRVCALLAGS